MQACDFDVAAELIAFGFARFEDGELVATESGIEAERSTGCLATCV